MARAFEGHLFLLRYGDVPDREDFDSAFKRAVPSGQYRICGPAAGEDEFDFEGEYDARDLYDFVAQLAQN